MIGYHTVSEVSQFMHDLREKHFQAINRIIKYLKTAPGRGLLLKKKGSLSMEIYTDADYARLIIGRGSTTGYCILGGNLVTWKSKKQNAVTRSSVEAEFKVMTQGECKLLWMKIILNDLKIKFEAPIKVFSDNKSVTNIAHNQVQLERTKHENRSTFHQRKIRQKTYGYNVCPLRTPYWLMYSPKDFL